MKKITVSLDDGTCRNARVKAAASGISVSALVKRYLAESGAGETEFQRLKRLERKLRARIAADFCAADDLTRDEVCERHA